ncbi:hypothetical protein K8P10_001724 [Leucobacter sp. Psy1]|nr:hypothetical protein K8P10_001724 [Leucobacter sp. Psy1]
MVMSLVHPQQLVEREAWSAPAIGRSIRARRRMLGVSQAELAARVGRSRKWVSELEGGSTSPGVDGVALAAESLGMELTLRQLDDIRAVGASLPGSFERPNEDAWGAEGPLAWVIDGATQPGETVQSLDARTYAHALSQAVRERAADTETSLTEILADAIDRAATWPAAEPGPAATVAMVRRSGSGFEWLVLGDAGLLLQAGGPGDSHVNGGGFPIGDLGAGDMNVSDLSGGGLGGSSPSRGAVAGRTAASPRRVTLITDDRLASVAVAEREARKRARAAGADAAEIAERSAELYRAELAMRNRPGGYWVASGAPEAARHALHGYADTLGPVLLVSDGMLDVLGTTSPWRTRRSAFTSWVESPPEESVARVREARSGIPGAKVDDATLVVVR